MAKRKAAPIELTVALDAEDRAWLDEQAYPLGIDAAGYLRMFVRQSRLGVSHRAMGVAMPAGPAHYQPRHTGLAHPENYPQPAPLDGDLGDFVNSVVDEAPESSPLADTQPHEAESLTGRVISLTPRPQAQPGPEGPKMSVAQAFGGG